MERSEIRDRRSSRTIVPALRFAPYGLRFCRLLDRADIDLRFQGAVNRTFVGNLQQPCALRGVEISLERDDAIDAVDLALLGLALGTIGGIDFFVTEPDLCPLKWYLLVIGIEPHRHRRAGAERRQ